MPRAGQDGRLERGILLGVGALMAVYGLTRRNKVGYGLITAGLGMIAKAAVPDDIVPKTMERINLMKARKVMTVYKDRAECYALWSDPKGWQKFMRKAELVTQLNDSDYEFISMDGSSWRIRVVSRAENELLLWESTEDSPLKMRGSVSFVDAPGDRGTEVTLEIEATSQGGLVGNFYGRNPAEHVKEDLRRFRCLAETGEIPTIAGQPQGQRMGAPMGSALVDKLESRTGSKERFMVR